MNLSIFACNIQNGNDFMKIWMDGLRDGIKRADILRNLELIEYCALITDPEIFKYVLDDKLVIPISMRYSYHKFFWELSKRR